MKSRFVCQAFLFNRNKEIIYDRGDILIGQQAIEKVRNLIVSDINMPNMDGFKLLELINQKGIDTPVILVPGRTGSEDEVKGLGLGAVDYIRKPIDKDILLVRTRNILKKRLKL